MHDGGLPYATLNSLPASDEAWDLVLAVSHSPDTSLLPSLISGPSILESQALLWLVMPQSGSELLPNLTMVWSKVHR